MLAAIGALACEPARLPAFEPDFEVPEDIDFEDVLDVDSDRAEIQLDNLGEASLIVAVAVANGDEGTSFDLLGPSELGPGQSATAEIEPGVYDLILIDVDDRCDRVGSATVEDGYLWLVKLRSLRGVLSEAGTECVPAHE
jgi:hypothetical protein